MVVPPIVVVIQLQVALLIDPALEVCSGKTGSENNFG
jgi:hypothetical protein